MTPSLRLVVGTVAIIAPIRSIGTSRTSARLSVSVRDKGGKYHAHRSPGLGAVAETLTLLSAGDHWVRS
jgi:hypothetical protein